MDTRRLYDGVIGSAIGDALGVPAEFMSRSQLERRPVTDMKDGGVWEQPEGTWSDDTSMMLATIDALNKHEWDVTDECLADIMNNFLRWYLHGDYAACGKRFDIGNTCETAICNWHRHTLKEDGFKFTGVQGKACGNGALMRILPCMFLPNETAVKISKLTHDNSICSACSVLYLELIRYIIYNEVDKFEALRLLREEHKDTEYYAPLLFMRLSVEDFINLKPSNINSSGYVIDTLEAAVWCFMTTDNYKDCVLKAVNLGDDTDTVAAVAGGLAGVYYGSDTIPKDWISKLRDIDKLKKIVFNE